MTAEMIAYVKAELTSGKSPADVRQSLLAAGWPPGDVEQALSLSLGPAVAHSPFPPTPPPLNPASGGWMIGAGGFRYRSRTAKKLTPGQSLVVGVLFAAVGMALVYFGSMSYMSAKSLADNGLRADGTVIDVEEKIERDSDGTSRTYRPVVEYALPNGDMKQYRSDLWRNPSPFQKGQKVRIVYDPASGETAIDTGGELFGASYIMLGIGLVFALAGAAIVISSRRRQPADVPPVQPPMPTI